MPRLRGDFYESQHTETFDHDDLICCADRSDPARRTDPELRYNQTIRGAVCSCCSNSGREISFCSRFSSCRDIFGGQSRADHASHFRSCRELIRKSNKNGFLPWHVFVTAWNVRGASPDTSSGSVLTAMDPTWCEMPRVQLRNTCCTAPVESLLYRVSGRRTR